MNQDYKPKYDSKDILPDLSRRCKEIITDITEDYIGSTEVRKIKVEISIKKRGLLRRTFSSSAEIEIE